MLEGQTWFEILDDKDKHMFVQNPCLEKSQAVRLLKEAEEVLPFADWAKGKAYVEKYALMSWMEEAGLTYGEIHNVVAPFCIQKLYF